MKHTVVKELLGVKRLQSLEDSEADSASTKGADDLILEIESILGNAGDVPAAAHDLFVGRRVITDEDEDGHDDMFSNGDDVRAGNLGNEDFPLVSSVQVCGVKVF